MKVFALQCSYRIYETDYITISLHRSEEGVKQAFHNFYVEEKKHGVQFVEDGGEAHLTISEMILQD